MDNPDYATAGVNELRTIAERQCPIHVRVQIGKLARAYNQLFEVEAGKKPDDAEAERIRLEIVGLISGDTAE